jgi:hypothetical protein
MNRDFLSIQLQDLFNRNIFHWNRSRGFPNNQHGLIGSDKLLIRVI